MIPFALCLTEQTLKTNNLLHDSFVYASYSHYDSSKTGLVHLFCLITRSFSAPNSTVGRVFNLI